MFLDKKKALRKQNPKLKTILRKLSLGIELKATVAGRIAPRTIRTIVLDEMVEDLVFNYGSISLRRFDYSWLKITFLVCGVSG
jgi:hypothetical protein